MFLKRITTLGFKSFPDKVDFDFGPGVTCIVGPNGCGKSNLVDAFRWVLGEQSARSLRGRQMTDMIFNGSSTRRGSSVAQVDLVWDNSDRSVVDLDLDEIKVTRKLYRSGESEYLLNRETVRLKDIRELFMDTGVGVDAYSVIEQGRVDSLLQSNPNDRRIIFEEAAGISKYKARRREAERKLERTGQNLLRLEDIIAEVAKRLRSVKLQAGKARSYKEMEGRLNELRSSYALAEYHRFTEGIEHLTRQTQQATDEVTAYRTDIDRHEAEEALLTSRLDSMAEEINVADSEFLQAKSELVAQEERTKTARERVLEQRGVREGILARADADTRRLDESRRELEDWQASSVALQQESDELHGRVAELTERDRRLARDLTQAQAILEDEKAGIIDLLRTGAQMHNEIIRLNTHRESLVGQRGRLSERDARITAELGTVLEHKAQLVKRTRELDALITDETERLEQKKTDAVRVDALKQELAKNVASSREQRSALQSRREVLEDLQLRMEGVGAAARQLLEGKVERLKGSKVEGCKPSDLQTLKPSNLDECLVGLVADIVETDVAHAQIIEAAIGESTKCLVITDSRTFLDHIGRLEGLQVEGKVERLEGLKVEGSGPSNLQPSNLEARAVGYGLPGRLTVVCLDRLPPFVNARDFSDMAGFVAVAIDLVRVIGKIEGQRSKVEGLKVEGLKPSNLGPSDLSAGVADGLERLARHLLGKTIVVESLEAALAMARTDVAGHRFVTLHGEVVEPDGRVTLGPSSSAAGLISRKSELRDIETRMIDIDRRIETLADQLNRTEAEITHINDVQQELRTAIYESNTAKVEVNTALQAIAENVGRLVNEQPLIAQEVAMLEQEINEALEKSEQGGRSLSAIERENEEREQTVGSHQERIDRIIATRCDVQEELTEAKVGTGKLSEKRAAAGETIQALGRANTDLGTAIAAARHDALQCEARIADIENMIAQSQQKRTVLTTRIDELEKECTGLRHQREMLRHDSEDLTQTVKNARGRLEAAEAKLHEHQMSLTETNVRRDDLVTRVAEELRISLPERSQRSKVESQRSQTLGPSDLGPSDLDWGEVEAQIAELRAKMDRLGNVNLEAITELEELENRHAFLSGQRDDLTESRRQLEQLIDRLNKESTERFTKTFEQIRENFRALFRKLFGGGRADIILEDPDNVLESGIEILAQPPGKDLQAISLMSGGEKSLTAIALLMSIFKNRPAPCTFLDEVDAALDEANNERFNRIIQEFVSEGQFIIITHSKWTMNIADHLYGITMQEPGVSTRVSVELTGAHVA